MGAPAASTENWPADSLSQLMTKLEDQVETNETAVTTVTIESNASDEDSRETGDESDSDQQPEADQAKEAKEENTFDEGTEEKSAVKQNDIDELDASNLPLMTPHHFPTLRERFLSLFKKTPELVTSDLESSSSVGTGLSSEQLSEDSKETSETDKMLKSVRFSSKLDLSPPSESGTMIIHDTKVQETAVIVIVKVQDPDNISETSSMP